MESTDTKGDEGAYEGLIKLIRRNNYPGQRKEMISGPYDGRVDPIYPKELLEAACSLTRHFDHTTIDYVIGFDSGGIILAIPAAFVIGKPCIIAYKADLEVGNKIHFEEPHSANPDIFIYNLPKFSRVLLADDEIRTGVTMMNCAKALEEAGNYVRGVIALLESTKFDVRKEIESLGYEFYSCIKHDQ